ncbi:MAG: transcriptional repressor [Bacteroidales bacterium]
MDSDQILNNNKLSKTKSRKMILDLFLNANNALSEKEIKQSLVDHADRATIYRTLKIFTDSGIIHPIFTQNEMTRYMLKKEPDEHLHFKCSTCEKVICLPQIRFDSIELPEGFTKMETNFLVIGTCVQCNN